MSTNSTPATAPAPAPKTRDWLANLAAQPQFTFHLKHGVVADLPATATVIVSPSAEGKADGHARPGPVSPLRPVVDLRAMIDIEDMNHAAALVDPVDDAIGSAPRTVTTGQWPEKRLTDPVRID